MIVNYISFYDAMIMSKILMIYTLKFLSYLLYFGVYKQYSSVLIFLKKYLASSHCTWLLSFWLVILLNKCKHNLYKKEKKLTTVVSLRLYAGDICNNGCNKRHVGGKNSSNVIK